MSPADSLQFLDRYGVVILPALAVVLYCASPNDTASARVALQLKHTGISRVRPLEGGLAAWMALNLPVRAVQLPVAVADGNSRGAQPTAA
jgi:3-mercaptopyruvate sulfurtransferase SseA